MKKNLLEKAVALFDLSEKIKQLTEEAEVIKKDLRLNLAEAITLPNGVICSITDKVTPVFNNEKLYGLMTHEEICTATKPLVGELKKIFPDTYDDILDTDAVDHLEVIKCVTFTKPKKS